MRPLVFNASAKTQVAELKKTLLKGQIKLAEFSVRFGTTELKPGTFPKFSYIHITYQENTHTDDQSTWLLSLSYPPHILL